MHKSFMYLLDQKEMIMLCRGPSKHHSCKLGSNWQSSFRAVDKMWNIYRQRTDGKLTPNYGKCSHDPWFNPSSSFEEENVHRFQCLTNEWH